MPEQIKKLTKLDAEVEIHHVEAGEGTPLVLLHGGGPGSSGVNNFRLNYEFFVEQGFRVLMPDHIGWGRSSKPTGRIYDLNLLAGSIQHWLAAIGIEKCHVVGNSMGGAVALSLALDSPDLVDRLVLLGPAGVTSPDVMATMRGVQRFRSLSHLIAPEIITDEAIVSVLRVMVHDPSVIEKRDVVERLHVARTQPKEVLASLKLDSLLGRLTQMNHETLIFWGLEDSICPVDSANALLKLCTRGRLVVFSACAHLVQVERANTFNRLTADFLRHG